jgi:predicted nucleic acid-binding Zn ribbon protein
MPKVLYDCEFCGDLYDPADAITDDAYCTEECAEADDEFMAAVAAIAPLPTLARGECL